VKGRIKVKKGVTLFVIDEGEIIAEMEQTILSPFINFCDGEIFPLFL